MQAKGSVTIYLCLVLTVILSLLCTMTEAARVYAAKAKISGVTYVAGESVKGEYVREIFDEYGLLMYWDNDDLEDEISQYINSNLELSALDYESTDLFGVSLLEAGTENVVFAMDDGGEELISQIVSYMEYKSVGEAVDFLIEQFDTFEESSDEESPSDQAEEMDEYNTELYSIAETLSAELDEIAELAKEGTELAESAAAAEFGTSAFERIFKKITKSLNEASQLCDETIATCGEYEAEKERLIENGADSAEELVSDTTVSDMTAKLEKAADLIEEFEESDGSDEEKTELAENIYEKLADVGTIAQSSVSGNGTNPKDLLEYVKGIAEDGILGLLIDDADISDAAISSSENLPSVLYGSDESEDTTDDSDEADDGDEDSVLSAVSNKALFTYYLTLCFDSFSADSDEGDGVLSYELEYILSGGTSDRDNLTTAIEKTVLIREVFNMAYLAADSEKRNEAYQMALAFTGAVGLPALAGAAMVIILAAWALAESVIDVRDLLNGGSVALVKTDSTWNLSLENVSSLDSLLTSQDSSADGESEDTGGMTYENYIFMLLLLQSETTSVYRMADIIQLNMQSSYNSEFLISECVLSFDVSAEYEIRNIFCAIPLVKNTFGITADGYETTEEMSFSY